MKLPEDKKERIRFIVLAAMAVVGGVYISVSLGILPMFRSHGSNTDRKEELLDLITVGKGEVAQIEQLKTRESKNMEAMKEFDDLYVLRPRLGNYLLSAKDIIEGLAVKCNVEVENIREVGPAAAIPAPAEQERKNALKSYTAAVSLFCGYSDLSVFIGEIEKSNPYLCVTRLVVSGRSNDDPENHSVRLEIQWPVWDEAETATPFLKRLEEMETDGGTS